MMPRPSSSDSLISFLTYFLFRFSASSLSSNCSSQDSCLSGYFLTCSTNSKCSYTSCTWSINVTLCYALKGVFLPLFFNRSALVVILIPYLSHLTSDLTINSLIISTSNFFSLKTFITSGLLKLGFSSI